MRYVDFLDKGASLFPDRHVVHDLERGWTYKEFVELTKRIASALIGEGLEQSSKVATFSPNHPMTYAAQFGILRAGCIWTPLNARNSLRENIEVVAYLDVEWIFYHSSFAEDVAAMQEAIPGIRGAICLDDGLDGAPGLDAWIQGHEPLEEFPVTGPNDFVVMLTTSGTTGRPKGVMLTNTNWSTMVASYQSLLRFDAPPVHLIAAPLTHAAGAFAGSLLSLGATHVLLPKPDPLVILQTIDQFRVNTLLLTPTMIYMLLAHPEIDKYDYSSLRYFVYGAAPISPEKLREAVRVFGPVMAQTYGQTEALMVCTYMSPQEHQEALNNPALERRLWSSGREGPLARVEIMSDDGRILPPGQPGEIVCRGSLVMTGYYKNPEATAEVSAFGWHHTGDVGMKDESGYVYILDRKRDMIISGGFNVFPTEVEQIVMSHPCIQDCAVVGVPDEKWGEAVKAVVELRPNASLQPDELIAFCRERLGGVKTPKTVEIWLELPRSPVGKVLRREVRARYWVGHERAI